MIIRKAKESDINNIVSILSSNNLPSGDCQNNIKNFQVVELEDIIIAVGCLEKYATTGFLRSIAVSSMHRGCGYGYAIFNSLMKNANQSGISSVFLLTETAEQYFTNLGFTVVERENAPDIVKQTNQYRGLCPDSALVMCREI